MATCTTPGSTIFRGGAHGRDVFDQSVAPVGRAVGGDRLPLAELLKSICGTYEGTCPGCSLRWPHETRCTTLPVTDPIRIPDQESP